jgi:PD-(D/E)XK nuclease superfamily protein
MQLRIPSPLEPETENIVTNVTDGAMAVHKELGPGLLERTYADAMSI